MKKHSEKPPIDDLFARKLGNMSLKPSPDGFERLQARMGKAEQKPPLTIWRNPAMQRYMAAAACLAVVCLFGWLYWPSGEGTASGTSNIAANSSKKNAEPIRPEVQSDTKNELPAQSAETGAVATDTENQIATASPSEKTQMPIRSERSNNPAIQPKQTNVPNVTPNVNEPVVAQQNTKPETASPTDVTLKPAQPAEHVAVAENKSVEKPTSERGLVVTIEEPATLVAARQAVKAAAVDEKQAVAINDKPEKEGKGGSLWQQVKRLKQGELLARREATSDEDRGLLERAYNGLKHGLEKEKSTKNE